eukprot:SAG11_NODE_462_length_9229_cov_18.235926_1_plen_260_part_00
MGALRTSHFDRSIVDSGGAELEQGSTLLALAALQAIRRVLPTPPSLSAQRSEPARWWGSAPPPAAASTVYARYIEELASDDATLGFVGALRFGATVPLPPMSSSTGGSAAAVLDGEWRFGGRPSTAMLPREQQDFERGTIVGVGAHERHAALGMLILREAAGLLRRLPPRPLATALQRERVEWSTFEAALIGGDEPDLRQLQLALAPLRTSLRPGGVVGAGGASGGRQQQAVALASAATSVGSAMRGFIRSYQDTISRS